MTRKMQNCLEIPDMSGHIREHYMRFGGNFERKFNILYIHVFIWTHSQSTPTPPCETWVHEHSISENKSCRQSLNRELKVRLRNEWNYTSVGIWNVGCADARICHSWQKGNLRCLTRSNAAVRTADMRCMLLVCETAPNGMKRQTDEATRRLQRGQETRFVMLTRTENTQTHNLTEFNNLSPSEKFG